MIQMILKWTIDSYKIVSNIKTIGDFGILMNLLKTQLLRIVCFS